MKPFSTLTAHTAVLPQANIDTDQIIPARFLKVVDKQGLGEKAFFDWRFHADGSPNPAFPLNQEPHRSARILVAGDNFGCGSSREHAPWALLDFGFRAVISTRVADIFRGNALNNGLLALEVEPSFHRHLLHNAGTSLTVKLEQQLLTAESGRSQSFDIDPFAKYCLMRGLDRMDFLLEQSTQLTRFEEANP